MPSTHKKPQPIKRVTMEDNKTIKLVESDLPDTYLISTTDLIKDVKNRIKINNYEVQALVKDVTKLGKQFRPYVISLVEGVKELRTSLSK